MRRSAYDVAIAVILGVWLFLTGAPWTGALLGVLVVAVVLMYLRAIAYTISVHWERRKESKSRYDL